MLATVLKEKRESQTSISQQDSRRDLYLFVWLVCFFYLLSRTARAQIDPGEALAISQGPLMGVIIFSLRELTV